MLPDSADDSKFKVDESRSNIQAEALPEDRCHATGAPSSKCLGLECFLQIW